MQRVKLTRAGEIKLHEELKRLKEIERPRVIAAIAEARRKGDLSENAEYDAAKEEQHNLELRIHNLEVKLSHVQVIDNVIIASDKVYIGAKVDLEDTKTGADVHFTLVDEFEADFAHRKISTVSPIGKALLGKKVGETVEITIPNGTLTYVVKKITRD